MVSLTFRVIMYTVFISGTWIEVASKTLRSIPSTVKRFEEPNSTKQFSTSRPGSQSSKDESTKDISINSTMEANSDRGTDIRSPNSSTIDGERSRQNRTGDKSPSFLTKRFELLLRGNCSDVDFDSESTTQKLRNSIRTGKDLGSFRLEILDHNCSGADPEYLTLKFRFDGHSLGYRAIKLFILDYVDNVNESLPFLTIGRHGFFLRRVVLLDDKFIDRDAFIDGFMMSLFIALGTSFGGTVIVWAILWTVYKCYTKPILPPPDKIKKRVSVKKAKYSLKKVPRVTNDYIRSESMTIFSNDLSSPVFHAQLVPVDEDDIITISARVHDARKSSVPSVEEMTMTPRQFHTFSKILSPSRSESTTELLPESLDENGGLENPSFG